MDQLNQIIDPATGLPLGQALWQQIALSLFGLAAIVISVVFMLVGNLARKYLPQWVSNMVDEKTKEDIHGAAITIARRIILEGGDPRENLQMGIDYMVESAKDGYKRAIASGRSAEAVRNIFGNILISKIPLVVAELNQSSVPQLMNMPAPVGQPDPNLATMDTAPAEVQTELVPEPLVGNPDEVPGRVARAGVPHRR